MVEKPKVLIVGSVALDDIETPFGAKKAVLGGSAIYASISASHFAPAAIVGVVGDDFPQEHVRLLESRAILLDGLQKQRGKTFHWSGAYKGDMSQAETHHTLLGVFEDFSPDIPKALRGSPWLLLGNIHPALQLRVLEQMDSCRLVAADTMNFWITGEPETLSRLISKVNLMFINDAEIRQLTGETNLHKAAANLLEMGPEYVVLKRGEHGMSLHTRQATRYIPAFPAREVCDPTGAGDSLAGGLMGYLAMTDTLNLDTVHTGAVVGTVMSSFCIEGFSPIPLAALERAAIRGRLEELVELFGRETLLPDGFLAG